LRNYLRKYKNVSQRESRFYELKHEPLFSKGCSELLGQRKQAKLQWLQDPSEINGNNMNNVRCEASRHFRNIKGKYLKYKINKLSTNIKTPDK
jgi:hypothetical protein